MRMLLATLCASTLAAGLVHAQGGGTPKNCGYHIEILDQKITANTQAVTKCNHAGKVRITVNNLDKPAYTVKLQNFKYKAPDAATKKCVDVKKDGKPPIHSPFVKASTTTITTKSEDVKVVKDKIANVGDAETGCYAFDVYLYNGATQLDHLDPELEVTEPGNPPPPPPPPPKF